MQANQTYKFFALSIINVVTTKAEWQVCFVEDQSTYLHDLCYYSDELVKNDFFLVTAIYFNQSSRGYVK